MTGVYFSATLRIHGLLTRIKCLLCLLSPFFSVFPFKTHAFFPSSDFESFVEKLLINCEIKC